MICINKVNQYVIMCHLDINISSNVLLNQNRMFHVQDINNNTNKIQELIVTYFMLTNIITRDIVADISNEINKWIYYVKLIKN